MGADNPADGADLISFRSGFPQFEPVIFTSNSVLFPMVFEALILKFVSIKFIAMHENDISFLIRKAIFTVYNTLGPGLYESVYITALRHELEKLGLTVSIEMPLPLIYDGIRFEAGFRIDMMVNERVIIEVKSVEKLAEVHHKQIITYLRLSAIKLGILVNFNTSKIADSIHRKVNNL